ncbi:MAG: TetR/AcrR family transcriptional regulator [Kofleriaceae bacterium]
MRRLITSAAQRLFLTEGYESTTIRRIAEAIEYTPGAIYSYFKDKDAILYALHQQGFIELERRLLTTLTPGQRALVQLRELGQAFLAFSRDNPEMYHLMFVAHATSRALHAADEWPEGKRVYDALRGLVVRAIAEGEIRPGDPEVIAFGLWAIAHGAATLEICDRCIVVPDARRATIAAEAFQYLLGTMSCESASPLGQRLPTAESDAGTEARAGVGAALPSTNPDGDLDVAEP